MYDSWISTNHEQVVFFLGGAGGGPDKPEWNASDSSPKVYGHSTLWPKIDLRFFCEFAGQNKMIGCTVHNEENLGSRFHAVTCTIPINHLKSIANGAIEAQLIRKGSDGEEHRYSKQTVSVEKLRPTGGERHALTAMVIYNGYHQSCHMLQNYVAYHLLAGFTHFYVYDVSQVRNIRWEFMPASACVAALGDAGIADVVNASFSMPFKGIDYKVFMDISQTPFINHCTLKYKEEADWIMIADLDEFILPLDSLSVLTTVSKYDIDTVMGVGIRQCTVGAEKGLERGFEGPSEQPFEVWGTRLLKMSSFSLAKRSEVHYHDEMERNPSGDMPPKSHCDDNTDCWKTLTNPRNVQIGMIHVPVQTPKKIAAVVSNWRTDLVLLHFRGRFAKEIGDNGEDITHMCSKQLAKLHEIYVPCLEQFAKDLEKGCTKAEKAAFGAGLVLVLDEISRQRHRATHEAALGATWCEIKQKLKTALQCVQAAGR
jgi:hypothetical protein